MALENEVVAKNDPEEQPPAEAEGEEEEDLIDPVDALREKCELTAASQKYFAILEECNSRVSSKTETEETCHEEMMDWVHAVDACIAEDLFKKLK